MFKRYTPASRRAIYYAREAALHARSPNINSMHILSGLLFEPSTRADTSFNLSQRFPEECLRMRKLQKFSQPAALPLAQDSKRILNHAAREATRMNDYWIDTDHLLLAILCELSCPAATLLNKSGLETRAARDLLLKTHDSREEYDKFLRFFGWKNPSAGWGSGRGCCTWLAFFSLFVC